MNLETREEISETENNFFNLDSSTLVLINNFFKNKLEDEELRRLQENVIITLTAINQSFANDKLKAALRKVDDLLYREIENSKMFQKVV
jgi:hypothetical protein